MSVRSGQAVIVDFTTRRFETGAATAADSLPTGVLVINGTDNGATITITSKTGGKYKAALTLPTLAIGDIVQLRINATVNSINDNGIVWDETKDVELDVNGKMTVGTNSDKTGYALTTGERTSIANEVEAQIIDETDSEKVLTAITDKIASVNPSLAGLTLASIAAAVRDVLNTSPAANSLGAVINAIKAKTDNLPSDPADASDIAASFTVVNSSLSTIASYIDTEVAAIKAKTDQLTFTIPNRVDVSSPTVDEIWDEPMGTATAGPATTMRGAVRQLWRKDFAPTEQDTLNYTFKCLADNGTTVLLTQSYAVVGAGKIRVGAAA